MATWLAVTDDHHRNIFPISSMKTRTKLNPNPTFTELEPNTKLIFQSINQISLFQAHRT